MNRARPKKREKSEVIKRAIIDSAVPLVVQEGYGNLTIKAICEHAGITTGTFYWYFKSKDDVISFAHLDLVKEVIENIDEKIAGKPLPDQLVLFYTELIGCNYALGRESLYTFLNNENPECDCHVSRGYILDVTERIVSEAVAQGFELSEGRDARAICEDLIVVVKGITYDWYSQGDSYNPVEKGRAYLNRVINSLL